MAGPNPWPTIAAERAALADDLEQLTDAQWSTPSLCEGWSVREVLGHMAATARVTVVNFFPKLVASGFRLTTMQEKDITRETEGTPTDTLRRFRDIVPSTKHPPGPALSWLGETIIHSEDIRRPLGMTHVYPADALRWTADFFKGTNLVIGSKKRIAGLKLTATDAEWTTGEGPEVRGPMVSLLMTMTGREAFLDDLDGDGVATLRTR